MGAFPGVPLCRVVTLPPDTRRFGVSCSVSDSVLLVVRGFVRASLYPALRLRVYRPNLRVRAAARGSVWS